MKPLYTSEELCEYADIILKLKKRRQSELLAKLAIGMLKVNPSETQNNPKQNRSERNVEIQKMTKEYILGELKERIEDIAILRAKSARTETLSKNALDHDFKEFLIEASNSYFRRYREELVRLDGFMDSYLDALIETANETVKGNKSK